MKLKQLALIVGLLSSATAFAAPVTVAEIDAARSNGTLQQAWITGATAPTLSVYEGWVGSGAGVGCDVGTNTIFSTQTGTASRPGSIGNVFAYACRRNNIVSVLYSTISGGSLSAYTPHTIGALPERIRFVGTGNGCSTTVNYVDATNSENNATVFKGCALVAGAAVATVNDGAPTKPAGGFSDVEAALFPATIGGGNVASFGAEAQALVGQVFGVVVSTPLYRALQTAQGLSDVNATTYDPANAPNMTSAQYASIITQGGAYQTDWSPIVGAAGVGKKVILARRVATSGSQASSNAFFLKNPCASGVNAGYNPAGVADTTSTFEVVEGSGTGNVKTRLSTASTAGDFAIGVVSLENDWRADLVSAPASAGYRFVKLDGVHPETGDVANARVTAATGAYPFHFELVNFVANTATGFAAAIIPEITTALAQPATTSCATLPRGITLNPLGGSSCTVGVQVAKGTNLGNNCSPAQLTQ